MPPVACTVHAPCRLRRAMGWCPICNSTSDGLRTRAGQIAPSQTSSLVGHGSAWRCRTRLVAERKMVMRILQVAPLFERVPPIAYGGTERVVSYLTETLVDLGHDVTLLASGDSITNARLLTASPR